MQIFIDTSALVKLFHEENGTDSITRLIENNKGDLFISELTILEFTSALQRLLRAGYIEKDNLQIAMSAFKDELILFNIRSLNKTVIKGAEQLLIKHGHDVGLRTLDSIQLSSYSSLNLDEGLFVASDSNLLSAANAIGIKTYNPLDDYKEIDLTRKSKVLLVILSVVMILIVLVVPRMGHYLVVDDSLEEADIIVVLMGSVPARVLEAADIYGEGFARELVLVQSFMEAEGELAARGVVIPGHAELTRDAAVQMGVPESRITILPGGARSTKDEALIIRDFLRNNPQIDSVILVTSSFHSRRTKVIFERFCGDLEQEVIFSSRASSYDTFQPQHWWRDRESAKLVVLEYLKLAHFYFWERW